jgi:hypothetical protein
MTINITLDNTDQGDLFVTVVDQNLAGSPTILTDKRINQGQTFALGVQEDGNGAGNIQWTATRTDDASKTAQHSATPSNSDHVSITTFFG